MKFYDGVNALKPEMIFNLPNDILPMLKDRLNGFVNNLPSHGRT